MFIPKVNGDNLIPWLLKSMVAFAIADVWATMSLRGQDAIICLTACACFDYLTGLLAAGYCHELNSRKGFWGIFRKGVMLGFVMFIHFIEKHAGMELNLEVVLSVSFGANEMVSIIENCKRMDVPIPDQFVQLISKIRLMRFDETTTSQDLRTLGKMANVAADTVKATEPAPAIVPPGN